MPDELKKIDYIYADSIKHFSKLPLNKDIILLKASNIVADALIKMGLKETARQFNKLIQKI